MAVDWKDVAICLAEGQLVNQEACFVCYVIAGCCQGWLFLVAYCSLLTVQFATTTFGSFHDRRGRLKAQKVGISNMNDLRRK